MNTETAIGDAEMPTPSLLLVDDDRPFLQRLGRAMESRGFDVTTAETVREGISHVGFQSKHCHLFADR